MPTITDTLAQLGQDLRAAIASVLGLEGRIQQKFDANTSNVTTIINNFLGRPPIQTIFVDPLNGKDTNDGGAPSTAKRDLDAVLDGLGTSATSIMLLNDAVIRRRRNLYATLGITGARSNGVNGIGYELVTRTISFLAEADNSPDPVLGRFSSGFFLVGSGYASSGINYSLPDKTVNSGYGAHLFASSGTNVNIGGGTLLVASVNAGALIYSQGNSMNVFSTLIFGANAAGHLFLDVPAGGNPNSSFSYKSNVTSA